MGVEFSNTKYTWDLLEENDQVLSELKFYCIGPYKTLFNDWFGEFTEDPRAADIIVFPSFYSIDGTFMGQPPWNNIEPTTLAKEKTQMVVNTYFNTLDKPKVAFGTSSIVLGMLNGATLINFANGQNGNHMIHTNDDQEYLVISTCYDLLNIQNCDNAQLLAWSNVSSNYSGHVDFKLEKGKLYKEPEVVYFENSKSLCVHFAPEKRNADDNTRDYVKGLIVDLVKNHL